MNASTATRVFTNDWARAGCGALPMTTIRRALWRLIAASSFGLYRIRASCVIAIHLRRAISASHSSSGHAGRK